MNIYKNNLKLNLHKIQRRPFLLLEIMIAFALVVVCALPLLAPQLWMVEKEKQAVREIEADRLSNLVFIYIAEQLYSNEITWDQLTTGLRHDFEIKGWLADQFLYTTYSVQYDFKELRVDVEDLGKSKHLFQLNIYFIPALKTQKSLVFGYKIFVERDLKLGSDKPGADKNNPKPEKPEKEKETK